MLKNVKGKMANWVLLIRVFIPDLNDIIDDSGFMILILGISLYY